MDKLSTLEQKLRDLDKATSSRNVLASTGGGTTTTGKGQAALTVGGMAIEQKIIDDMTKAAKGLGYKRLSDAFAAQPGMFSQMLSQLHPTHRFSADEISKAVFGYSGPVPPIIGAGGPGPMAKAMTQLFQRLGGTGLSQIPGFSALGGMWTVRPITQILSGITGASLLTVAAGFAVLTAGVLAVVAALKIFAHALEAGAKLYDQAAKSGISLAGRARLNQIAAITGLSESELERLGLAGEAGRGKRFGVDSMIMAARGLGMGGTAQQLLNERWAINWRDAQPGLVMDEQVLADIAKRMKEIEMLSYAIGQNFLMWEHLFADFIGDQVKGVLVIINAMQNSIAEAIAALKEMWDGIPDWLKNVLEYFFGGIPAMEWKGLGAIGRRFGPHAEDPRARPWLLQEPYHPSANRFERMGFVTAPFARESDYAKETAHNTKIIAQAVSGRQNAITDRIAMIKQRHSLQVWASNPNMNPP
jgi:hypothetical protein